jgi:hypothetical protein
MENIKLKYDTDEIDVTLPKSISSSGWWLVESNVSTQAQTNTLHKDLSTNLPISKGTI